MRIPSPQRALATPAVLILVVMVLGACSARDGGGLVAGGTDAKPDVTVADFAKSTFCPPVEIRAGTEAMTVYERGREDERDYVRYQASIAKSARECSQSGGTLTMKIGISGRVLAGPKGGAGSITLPLRVAVVKQTQGASPVFSNLYKIPVTITPPTLSTAYNQVFDGISVPVGPQDRDLIVFVGFDEG